MKFKISHTTEYSYSDSVFFEPHYFRFKPKVSTYSSIIDFELKIKPDPVGYSEQIDIENNSIRLSWFEGLHQKLRIEVDTVFEVSEYNPFNFLVHPPEYLNIPFKYSERTNELLKPSLQTGSLPKTMKDFINELLVNTNNQSINFLLELTRHIHKEFVLENRETGEPHKTAYTFEQKKGSCRDLAWMQIHLLRHLGIGARFVSGYFYLDSDNPEFELHAWLEAFLPGAGWIGFDPSHGIITGSYHIPLASSAFFENTMPVSGTVRGNALSTMEYDLKIDIIK